MTTETQGWHADPALLSSYIAGELDAVSGASVEQHVSLCETCRAKVGELLEPQLLERTWAGIRDAVERPPLPVPIRLARPVCSAIFQCGRLIRFTNDGAVMQTMHAQVGCAKR